MLVKLNCDPKHGAKPDTLPCEQDAPLGGESEGLETLPRNPEDITNHGSPWTSNNPQTTTTTTI